MDTSKEAIRQMRDAIVEQAKKVSEKIKNLDIEVGATTGENKAFDHFIAFADKSDKIAENILKLDDKLNPEKKEDGEERSNNPLTKRFGGTL